MQHFSNYFVQIIVIRSRLPGGKDGPGGGRKKFQGGSCPPCLHLWQGTSPIWCSMVSNRSIITLEFQTTCASFGGLT